MTTIAIGLDSAEPAMLEEFIDELPNLKALKEKGLYGRLDNFDVFTAELPWTTFATGLMPEETGYWTPLKYNTNYTIHSRKAYEYDEYPAFFALGENFKVCAFDVPQVRLQKNLNGMQFNAWGAHSPQVDQESNVPEVYKELIKKYGIHPGLHQDYALALDMRSTRKVYDMLMEGIELRGKICQELMKKDSWDLFLTVYGEPHGGGHNFWQLEPDHPLHGKKIPHRELLPERPMKDIFKAIDKSIGEILSAAPQDSNVVIFSAHGMGPNTMDVPSLFFLPEFLYRYNFGRHALGDTKPLSSEKTSAVWGTWERDVWNTLDKGNFIIKFARRYLPTRVYTQLAKFLEFDDPDYPMSPTRAKDTFTSTPWWQPTFWYSLLWPKMKVFALPSFSEGYIRVNLKGREEKGIVDPSDYDRVVEDICNELKELKCARTGKAMVRKFVKTRKDLATDDKRLSDADIVVAWQEEFATDSVVHPKFGRIGPVPHFRAGSHRHVGFMLAAGPQIPQKSGIKNGHALDIAPTILSLIKATPPNYMRGKCLEEINQ